MNQVVQRFWEMNLESNVFEDQILEGIIVIEVEYGREHLLT